MSNVLMLWKSVDGLICVRVRNNNEVNEVNECLGMIT